MSPCINTSNHALAVTDENIFVVPPAGFREFSGFSVPNKTITRKRAMGNFMLIKTGFFSNIQPPVASCGYDFSNEQTVGCLRLKDE